MRRIKIPQYEFALKMQGGAYLQDTTVLQSQNESFVLRGYRLTEVALLYKFPVTIESLWCMDSNKISIRVQDYRL